MGQKDDSLKSTNLFKKKTKIEINNLLNLYNISYYYANFIATLVKQKDICTRNIERLSKQPRTLAKVFLRNQLKGKHHFKPLYQLQVSLPFLNDWPCTCVA